jgi:hypothetical protein
MMYPRRSRSITSQMVTLLPGNPRKRSLKVPAGDVSLLSASLQHQQTLFAAAETRSCPEKRC